MPAFFSDEKDRSERSDERGSGDGKELGGVERWETVNRIYYVRVKTIFNKMGRKTTKNPHKRELLK